jgi:precorrin-3B methylase
VLIVAGLVAIPVSVVPGIPIIAAGAAMLGSDHPFVRSGRGLLQNLRLLP